jgi:hypothetical protein
MRLTLVQQRAATAAADCEIFEADAPGLALATYVPALEGRFR